jgi:LemA protein
MEYAIYVVIAIIIIMLITTYNKLVSYQQQYKNGFEQISVQLKRRIDLIGNLVEVAKKYMKHEKETLMAVTEARAGLTAANNAAQANPGDSSVMAKLAGSQMAMDNAMGGFQMKMEDYPDLKASENMAQLSEEMTSTENRIASARQGYNDLVLKFNEYKRQFPTVMLAGLFGFSDDANNLEFEESVVELNKAPKVSF